jgi:hypothetical protein
VAGTLTRNEVFGPGAVSTGVNQYIDFLGGGLSGASAVTKVTRVRVDTGGIISEADVGNLNTARKLHACCDNYWGDPGAGNFKAWVFGGFNAAWARLTSIESWAPATTTATTMVAVLPTALANSTAVYYPTTNKVYIFGGSSAVTTVATIYEYDITGDTIALHATPMTVGLKNAAGAYSPIDGKIYIIGGEVAAGTMSTKIYSFDPATGTYAEETGIVTTLDNEDVEDGTTRPWAVAVGRNCACLARLDTDDAGQILLAGGRLTSDVGALTAGIYTFYPKDGIIGPSQYVNPGSLMYDTELANTEMLEFYGDTFANLAGWTDLSSAWTASGGEAVANPTSSGWLVPISTPTAVNQRFLLGLKTQGAGACPDFKFACRSGWGGVALTDGYYLLYTYDGSNAVWSVNRMNASVNTVLGTLDVTGVVVKQLVVGSYRTLEFRVEETSPVHLVATFNGYSIFDIYDFDASRITSVGTMGVFGGAT